MLVHRGLGPFLAGGNEQLNYLAGQTAVLGLNPQHSFQSYVLTAPDRTESRVTPDLKQQVLVVPFTDQLGNYRVQAGGTAGGVDRGFSVNLPAEQTRLERISQGELAQHFGPVPVRIARNREEIDLDFGPGGGIWHLFPILVFAAAVVLGLEHVTANRFYKK